MFLLSSFTTKQGFPGGSDGKKIHLQCRRPGFSPWVGKIPLRRTCPLTPVFLPEESPWTEEAVGYSPWGCKELDTTDYVQQSPSNSVLCSLNPIMLIVQKTYPNTSIFFPHNTFSNKFILLITKKITFKYNQLFAEIVHIRPTM